MNRREFLQCAAILISGVSASQLGFSLSEEQQAFLANAPDFNTTAVDYFSPAQREDCGRDVGSDYTADRHTWRNRCGCSSLYRADGRATG